MCDKVYLKIWLYFFWVIIMNILITGANGLLGKNLVAKLSIEHEHNVYALVKDKKNLLFPLNQKIKILEIDLSNFDVNLLPKDIDVIYYLAQSNKFREFPEGSSDIFNINIFAPFKIIEWAKKNGTKIFVYASSGGVYTNPNRPVKEFFDINANEKLGFYLKSKLSGEMLLKNYAEFFNSFVIIRPFFMYGIGQNKSMLIPRLIENIKNGNKIIINGNNGIQINPIFISDAVEATVNILKLQGEHIINIAGKEVVYLKEIVEIISNILDIPPVIQYKQEIQNNLVADINIMCEILHNPLITLKDGIKKLIEADFK